MNDLSLTVCQRQAIVFDFDDTLIATNAWRKPLFLRFLQLFSDISSEELDVFWGRPMLEMLENLLPNIDSKEALLIYKNIMEIGPIAPLLPGVDITLKQLAKKGVSLMILTSSARSIVEADLERHDLLKVFTEIWSSDEISYAKPSPQVISPLLAWLSDRKLGLNEALYIGDSLVDYELAYRTGLPFIAVTTGTTDRTSFLKAGCQDIIDDFRAIVRCLPSTISR